MFLSHYLNIFVTLFKYLSTFLYQPIFANDYFNKRRHFKSFTHCLTTKSSQIFNIKIYIYKVLYTNLYKSIFDLLVSPMIVTQQLVRINNQSNFKNVCANVKFKSRNCILTSQITRVSYK